MVQAESQATITFDQMWAPAPTEKLVLTLKRAVHPHETTDSSPLPRPGILPEGTSTHLQYTGIQNQIIEASRQHGESKPAAAELEGCAIRPLKSHLRLNIFRAALIATWCCSNIALLLSNRYLLSSSFQQPVFLTLCHMAASSLVPLLAMAARTGPRPTAITRTQLGRIAVLAVVFCTSVVLGNVALKYLHVSFFQAIGATTPAFVAVLALVMMGQCETRGVYLSLVPVMAGLVLATGAEPSFNLLGFVATVTATALRGLKTVLQATLLKNIEPLVMMRYMALISTFVMLLATCCLEPDVLSVLPAWHGSGAFYGMLAVNCGFAFISNLSNFFVTKYTSPLTIQVLGNALGIFGTFISIMIFRNPVTLAGMCGYSITMLGVGIFVHEKRKSPAAGSLEERQPLISEGREVSSLV